jgi:hypothetical protein
MLPFFIHPFGLAPRIILPMHFPVFLAGLLLPPLYAGLVGVLTPALSSGFTGMPTSSQVMRLMPELAVYGMASSMMLRLLPLWPGLSERLGRITAMITAMLVAMIAGRIVYVAASMLMLGVQDLNYYLVILIAPAIPGIIAQLIIVPPLAYKLEQITHRK